MHHLQKPGTAGFEKGQKVTNYFFVLETVVLQDLPGHPIPGHARLGGALVAAHL